MELAATRLIAMRKNKGKSIAACLNNHTSYIQNPDKTEQGELVSSYQCSPLTVDEEFMLTKRLYEQTTGRRQKSDVIAYQVRQSFRPGEVTPEEANKIGYEFAERFLKGKHAFIVATHVPKRLADGTAMLCEVSGAANSMMRRWESVFREYPDILSDAENRASVERTIQKLRDYLKNLEDKMEELL